MALELRVASLGGHIITISVADTATVQELKAKIEATRGIPSAQQRVFHGTQELVAGVLNVVLSGYRHEEELLLILRPGEQARRLEEVERLAPSAAAAYFHDAPAEVQQDRDVVLAVVEKDGGLNTLAICCRLPAAVRADRLVILAAVAQHWKALAYASDELKADREVVLAAVTHNVSALCHASADLKADRDFILAAATQDVAALCFASMDLKADRDVILAAAAQNGFAIHFASEELKADRDVALAAVAQNGLALGHVSAVLKADRDVVQAAVRQNRSAIRFASAEVDADRDVNLACSARHVGSSFSSRRDR